MDDETLYTNGKRSRTARWREYMGAEVTEKWGDLVLIVTCFIAGLIDSAVFNVWSCFVSMQTGNTVYVGLGFTGQPASQPYRWVKSGTAILSFCIGNYVFSRVHRYFGPLKRGTLFGSFLAQAFLCFLAGLLVVTGVVPSNAGNMLPGNLIVLIPLAMLSFQSAGQIVVSRMLAYNELPTIVLTSTYTDLMMDAALFTAPFKDNPKRNRRFVSAVALVLGAGLGGVLTRDGDIEDPMWIAGIIKLVLAFVWAFWTAKGSIRLPD